MENDIELTAESIDMYDEYIRVPMYVEVDRILRLEPIDDGMRGFRLSEQIVNPPYVKTYEDTSDNPIPKGNRWDLSNWRFIAARKAGTMVGGCVVAFKSEEIHMLEGRDDIAVLWDIRVHPQMKRIGVGTRLFQMARQFAETHACSWLKIETQNVNVPACRFYIL